MEEERCQKKEKEMLDLQLEYKSECSVSELALVFHASYERSADDMTTLNKRISYAEKWYEYFSEKE